MTIPSNYCDSKFPLRDVRIASKTCSFPAVETFGQRIARLRNSKGWKRPELGRQMQKAVGRKEPFTGEAVRLYELDKTRPGDDARKALALVFNVSEQYIEFGKHDVAQQSAAEYRVSELALDVARRFDQLSPTCQEHVSHQIDLLKATLANGRDHDRAAQHDMVIKGGAVQAPVSRKRRRS